MGRWGSNPPPHHWIRLYYPLSTVQSIILWRTRCMYRFDLLIRTRLVRLLQPFPAHMCSILLRFWSPRVARKQIQHWRETGAPLFGHKFLWTFCFPVISLFQISMSVRLIFVLLVWFYKPYFFNQQIVFFSNNKLANSIFSNGLSAKRT